MKKFVKILSITVALVLLFGCGVIAGAMLLSVPTSQEVAAPTEIYVPKMVTTEANATNEAAIVATTLPTLIPTATSIPTPIPTPEPTPVPTPDCLTPGDIEHQRNILTDMQREIYEQEIVGAIVCFRGQVSEVYPDGDITLDDSSMNWNLARLQGVPRDVGVTLSKDQLFEGYGVVTEVSSGFLGLGMSIDIWVTSWNN